MKDSFEGRNAPLLNEGVGNMEVLYLDCTICRMKYFISGNVHSPSLQWLILLLEV